MYASFGAAMLAHLVLLVVAAMIAIDAPFGRFELISTVHLVDDSPSEVVVDPVRVVPRDRTFETDRGSSASAAVFLRDRTRPSAVAAPATPVLATRHELDDPEARAGLADEVAPLASTGNGGEGDGSGAGEGNGGGASAGSGFFGIKPIGNSIVYVVDCSGSMNLPHDSEWKTRFRRLKVEMVRSVGSMTPQQQFYIIYFNDKAYRMPSPMMQFASDNAKRHYLKWMADQKAIGQTDPRLALNYAMRLQPDMIYFLTDGAFIAKVERDLLKIRQNRTAIHTFAFGSRKGEKTMKQIAESNGGKYTYVP